MAQLDFSKGKYFKHSFDIGRRFILISDNFDGSGIFNEIKRGDICHVSPNVKMMFSELIRTD